MDRQTKSTVNPPQSVSFPTFSQVALPRSFNSHTIESQRISGGFRGLEKVGRCQSKYLTLALSFDIERMINYYMHIRSFYHRETDALPEAKAYIIYGFLT